MRDNDSTDGSRVIDHRSRSRSSKVTGNIVIKFACMWCQKELRKPELRSAFGEVAWTPEDLLQRFCVVRQVLCFQALAVTP